MTELPESGRCRSTTRRLLSVCLAFALVLSLSGNAVGTLAAVQPRTDDVGANADARLNVLSSVQDDVTLEIDCNESEVRVTAPGTFEYTLRVANVLVTPERSHVSTTTTTESGNATVSLSENAIVYAFASSDAEVVTSALQNCALEPTPQAPNATQTPNATTQPPESDVASVEIDCNASEVQVTAPGDFAYTLQISNIVATAASIDVSTTSRTATGNATVSLGDAGEISVFVSNETVTSAFENCALEERRNRSAE